jgi:hypothetical protein
MVVVEMRGEWNWLSIVFKSVLAVAELQVPLIVLLSRLMTYKFFKIAHTCIGICPNIHIDIDVVFT